MSGKREPGISYGTTAKLNLVNDPVPGGSNNFGTGATLYGGILGMEIELTDSQVQYDLSTGQLYGGRYKCIQTLSTGTNAPARGTAAFWSDPDNYVVSGDAGNGNFAGVFLNSITKGNVGYIQVAGISYCKFAVGQTPTAKLIVATTSTLNTFDALADGTALTTTNFKLIVGRAKEAGTGGSLSRVELGPPVMDSPFA